MEIEDLKPEAAQFRPETGGRAGIMVFDMANPADIPRKAEPAELYDDAAVELAPVMNADVS